jgi:hypothetical protein
LVAGGLEGEELGVPTAGGDQLVVPTLLDQPSVVQDVDAVDVPHVRQRVSPWLNQLGVVSSGSSAGGPAPPSGRTTRSSTVTAASHHPSRLPGNHAPWTAGQGARR